MSVPMVMNIMDSTATTTATIQGPVPVPVPVPGSPMDEHTEHCNALAYVSQRSDEPTPAVVSLPAQCFSSPRTFTVLLNNPLEANEHVGLTGDSFELGAWDPFRSVQLTAAEPNIWTGVVHLCGPGKVQYRYFVYTLDSLGHIQIKHWESYVEPRKIRICSHGCMKIDRFGTIEGHQEISRGWLTNEAIVQLQFLNKAFAFEGEHPENLYLKLAPYRNGTAMYSENLDNVEIVKMEYKNSVFRRQSNHGQLYKKNDIVVIQVAIPLGLESGNFALVLHNEDGEPVGHAKIPLSPVLDNYGKLELDIIAPENNKTVAATKISYIVIRPLAGVKLNFRTSYASTWKTNWNKILVGHRGNGISFRPGGAPITENTIASFKQAYNSSADMIELDVHITQDLVPVVYHDYKIFTAPEGLQPKTKDDLTQIYLKDIRYSDLVNKRIFRIIGDEIREYPAHNVEDRVDYRLFPKLEDVFQGLPIGLGINVEIKWPQLKADGTLEAEQIVDKNLFIDLILTTTLRHGCGRMLIFSSFDADICAMVRTKQNVFPVMFLTQGATKKWPAYDDSRCNSVEAAVNNAQTFEFIGIAPYAEDFLKEPQLARLATDLGQKVFLWGDDINSLERVRFFEDAGVTANIFDRVDLIIPKEKPGGIYDHSESIEYFRGQCIL